MIIEDNRDVSELLTKALRDSGYEAVQAFDGIEGSAALRKRDYSLVLLDLMLPFRSGDQLLGELRTFSDAPVIIVSAKDMIGTKIDLLRLGADDYITKPFDLGEVTARVESSLRRYKKTEAANERLEYGELSLDVTAKRAYISGKEVELTAKEYTILELLIRSPGKVYTKANLYELVWGDEYLGDDNAVKTHMSNLRGKLKAASPECHPIETVWGLGYRLCPPDRQRSRAEEGGAE